MGLESAKTIEGLDDRWPYDSDQWNQGDDHLRNIKKCLKNQFPGRNGDGFSKAITATEDELNYVEGVTSPIQEQFEGLDNEYVKKTGDIMTGALVIRHECKVTRHEVPGSNPISGYTIHGQNGELRAAFVEDDDHPEHAVFLLQEGPNTGLTWDTALTLSDGRANVHSPSGRDTTPQLSTDLVNKRYADTGTKAANQRITDLTTIVTALQNSVQILQAQVAAL